MRLQTPKEVEAEVEDDAEEDEAQEAARRESHTKARHESGWLLNMLLLGKRLVNSLGQLPIFLSPLKDLC